MKKKSKTYTVLAINKDGTHFVEIDETLPVKFLYKPDNLHDFVKSTAPVILKEINLKSEWGISYDKRKTKKSKPKMQ